MSNIYKFILYIFLIILYEINAKEVIIEIESKNINNFENVINENSENEENLVLKFKEKYYDMSNLPSERIDIFITLNVTFLGCSDGTIFDFKKNNNGMMNITYSNNNSNIVKFKNIIFKNFGQDINQNDYMFLINSDTDENYLKFENCIFTDIQCNIFEMNFSYLKEYNNISFNSDYFITFVNCDF